MSAQAEMNALPVSAAEAYRETHQESSKKPVFEEDLMYQPAIPGVEVRHKEAAQLDLWVRQQQMQWLTDGENRAELEHLNNRVRGRVRLAQQREVRKRATQIRREILFYILWVSLFSIVLSSFTLEDCFQLSSKVRDEVLGVAGDALEDVSTREGVWNFLADELVPSIYPEDATDPENKFRKNTQIGAMQLRQRRVTKNEGCTIPTVYKPILATCYPSLDTPGVSASKQSFGLEREFEATLVGVPPLQSWVFTSNLASNLNLTSAQAELRALQAANWLDLETAELVVLNTYYNPGVDMFCCMSLTFKFLATGGIDVQSSFRVFDPQRHLLTIVPSTRLLFPPNQYQQSFLLVVEVVFLCLIAGKWLVELRWLCKHGLLLWLSSVWHALDLVNCTLLLVATLVRLMIMTAADTETEFAPKPDEFTDFNAIAELVYLLQNLLGVAALLSYSKAVKYLQINPQVSALTRTFMHTYAAVGAARTPVLAADFARAALRPTRAGPRRGRAGARCSSGRCSPSYSSRWASSSRCTTPSAATSSSSRRFSTPSTTSSTSSSASTTTTSSPRPTPTSAVVCSSPTCSSWSSSSTT